MYSCAQSVSYVLFVATDAGKEELLSTVNAHAPETHKYTNTQIYTFCIFICNSSPASALMYMCARDLIALCKNS